MLVKTALFETLLESVTENGDGTLRFELEGAVYTINSVDEIKSIAQQHDYIIIY